MNSVFTFHGIAMKLSNPGALAPPFDKEKRRKAGLDPEKYLPIAEQVQKQRQPKLLERKNCHKSSPNLSVAKP